MGGKGSNPFQAFWDKASRQARSRQPRPRNSARERGSGISRQAKSRQPRPRNSARERGLAGGCMIRCRRLAVTEVGGESKGRGRPGSEAVCHVLQDCCACPAQRFGSGAQRVTLCKKRRLGRSCAELRLAQTRVRELEGHQCYIRCDPKCIWQPANAGGC